MTTYIDRHIKVMYALKEKWNIIEWLANALYETYQVGGKVVVFGNGGSAADAQHFVAELMGKFRKERIPLEAICLNTNISILTAVGNDYGYEHVFERQVKGLVKEKDLVIGISTSGNSPNVVNAIKMANDMGALTVGLTGNNKCELDGITNVNIKVPSDYTPHIQEAHITIIHIVCGMVEEKLFS